MGESFKAGSRRKIAGWQKTPRNLPRCDLLGAPRPPEMAAWPGKGFAVVGLV
jgi:hypothetical protein